MTGGEEEARSSPSSSGTVFLCLLSVSSLSLCELWLLASALRPSYHGPGFCGSCSSSSRPRTGHFVLFLPCSSSSLLSPLVSRAQRGGYCSCVYCGFEDSSFVLWVGMLLGRAPTVRREEEEEEDVRNLSPCEGTGRRLAPRRRISIDRRSRGLVHSPQ